jgi:hypothetical protein
MKRPLAILIVLVALLVPLATRAQQKQSAPAPGQPVAETKSPATNETASSGNPDTQVWVNTKTGIYHCPGTHWYGITKSGEYMKQSEAQKKGFRPAYYRPCK